MSAKSFSAVVLAAGGSTRLGSPKQLARLSGEPLVRRAARTALEAGARRVVVVTGAAAELVSSALNDLTLTTTHNPDWSSGPGTSVRAGVTTLLTDPARPSDEPVILLLCDQPLVDAAHIHALLSRLADPGIVAAASQYAADDPDAFGPPAAFTAALTSELLSLAAPQGARPVLARHRARVALVPFAAGLTDVDTPADAARLGLDLSCPSKV